jgi:tRNA(adenine34) deaminase
MIYLENRQQPSNGNDQADTLDLMNNHQQWMQYAIRLAQRAEEAGEVPVGAVLVKDNLAIAEGWNCSISTHDATAHAEIIALRAGGRALENYRLIGCSLYVTLEPCVMCMGAIVHARLEQLVFGAFDPRRGAAGSVLDFSNSDFLNHRLKCLGGVMENRCSELLKDFFKLRRKGRLN